MSTVLTQANAKRGLAFMAGLSFAAVPTVGPLLAILAIFTGRLTIQKADVWWWLSAILLATPYAIHGQHGEAVLSLSQVTAVWLIYRSATEFRRSLQNDNLTRDISVGLILGLATTLVLGLRSLEGFRFDQAITVLDAVVWASHPALFGHTILVLSALSALVVPSPAMRVLALAIGAAGVIISGSREAIWAWLLIAVILRFLGRRGTTGTRVAEWTLIGLMVFLVSGLASFVGLGRVGFLTDFAPRSGESNLFRGTEVGEGDWWFPLGVTMSSNPVTVNGDSLSAYSVTKQWTEPWARLQQVVTLVPEETYTLSAIMQTPDDVRPGFDGWGREAEHTLAANLATSLVGGVHQATATGDLTVINASVVTVDDAWQRVFVTFRYDGQTPLTWYVGFVPDRSSRSGVTSVFAELQLTRSYTLLPYRAGAASRGITDLRTSRLPIWRDAIASIAARPWLGWGVDGFPRASAALRPDEALLRPVAAHAHNAVLAAWVDRGIIGALGLIGLFALLGLRAVQQRDRAAAVVLVGVALLNTFDSTLLSGAVIYPLAAVLGWRAVGKRNNAHAETGVGSAAAVRLTLAVSDLLTGAASLALGLHVAMRIDPSLGAAPAISLPLAYATLVWPAVAAASRLYPGYGMPSYQELARVVRSSVAATILVGFTALLLPQVFGLTTYVFLIALPTSVILGPTLRSLAKFVLRRLRLWGRPVVVLGTEDSGARVARHLLNQPSIGLHPVAAFGSSKGWDVPNLPVSGSLADAWVTIEQGHIRHAIVTPEAATTAAFDQVLLNTGAHLKYVQYLPDLGGLPTNSVVATPIGPTLALEARNQLASTTNRVVKRVIDLLGALVLLAILAVPLLLIAGLIWLDSRGSPMHLSPRIGRYGKSFPCIKFRTMHPDAEERLKALLHDNQELRAEYERFHKLARDPRVTRVGRMLRRVSLDELPQLVNVLFGEMSLVGPRPYLERERDLMGSERDLILLARPGMTGYWQIEARNDVSFEDRQGMEAHYVRNWSVWWDIDIMLRTPGVMLSKTGK